MEKKRLLAVVMVVFLAQAVLAPFESAAQTYSIVPPSRIALVEYFSEAVNLGITLYKLDALSRMPLADIKREYSAVFNSPKIRFDLENIHLLKKGWTRYYPMSIGGEDFVIRIFLTDEKAYQHDFEVICEGRVQSLGVTFQVLRGLNEILKDCGIRPDPLNLLAREKVSSSI